MSKEYRTTSIAKTTGTLFIKASVYPVYNWRVCLRFSYHRDLWMQAELVSLCAALIHLPVRPQILDAIKHVSTLIAGATGTTSPVNSITVDRGIVIAVSYGEAPKLLGGF